MTTDHESPSGRPASPESDDWLDALLAREAAATPYVEDAGFTAGVMASLPPKAARAPYRWIVPAMGVLGFLIGVVFLSGGENLSLSLVRLASFESFSMQKLFLVAAPLGILYWLGVAAAWQER
jgi:hypothetical protein